MTQRALLIGFHPDVPGLPVKSEEIRAGLESAKSKLAADGIPTDFCLLHKDDRDDALITDTLRKTPYDIICIGAGLRVPPPNLLIFEHVINLVHAHAPQAKLAFNVSPEDTVNAVHRHAGHPR